MENDRPETEKKEIEQPIVKPKIPACKHCGKAGFSFGPNREPVCINCFYEY